VNLVFVRVVFTISIVLKEDQKKGIPDEAILPKEGTPPRKRHLNAPEHFDRYSIYLHGHFVS
jgi:hypothetical protein